MTSVEREVFAREEIKAMFLNDLTETRGRLRAPVDDIILFTRDWGFRLADVAVPVKWWHGDADHIVPLAHGRHCVERLPDARLGATGGAARGTRSTPSLGQPPGGSAVDPGAFPPPSEAMGRADRNGEGT